MGAQSSSLQDRAEEVAARIVALAVKERGRFNAVWEGCLSPLWGRSALERVELPTLTRMNRLPEERFTIALAVPEKLHRELTLLLLERAQRSREYAQMLGRFALEQPAASFLMLGRVRMHDETIE